MAQSRLPFAGQWSGGIFDRFADFAGGFSTIDAGSDEFSRAGGSDDGLARAAICAAVPARGCPGRSLGSQAGDDSL